MQETEAREETNTIIEPTRLFWDVEQSKSFFRSKLYYPEDDDEDEEVFHHGPTKHHHLSLSLLDSCDSFMDDDEDTDTDAECDVLMPSTNAINIRDRSVSCFSPSSQNSIFIKRRRAEDGMPFVDDDYNNDDATADGHTSILTLKRANPVYDEERDDENEGELDQKIAFRSYLPAKTRQRTTTVVVRSEADGVEVSTTTLSWGDRIVAAIAA